jgi:hypothetical protein
VFSYANRNSLDDEYFKEAENSLNNPFVYIVLSRTNTPLSNIIQAVTNKEFNHTSISLDAELKTMVAYNGGNGISRPGLNAETLGILLKNPNAKVRIFRLPVTRKQKETIIKEIKRINEEGSSYNVAGLFIKKAFMQNILICSQFVYLMLEKAKVNFFKKSSFEVQPMDFIELNHENRLEFFADYYSEDLIEKNA